MLSCLHVKGVIASSRGARGPQARRIISLERVNHLLHTVRQRTVPAMSLQRIQLCESPVFVAECLIGASAACVRARVTSWLHVLRAVIQTPSTFHMTARSCMMQVEKWLKRAFLPGMRTFRPSAVAIAITSPGKQAKLQ